MYYRRKLLLAILQKTAQGRLGKINLQKFLFLLCQKQNKPSFDFVPYQYGCFSFQANKDLSLLSEYYCLIDNKKKEWHLRETKVDYFCSLKVKDRELIEDLSSNLNIQNTADLINKVYDNYPYFTIKSQRTLNQLQVQKKKEAIQKIANNTRQLFSLGYEGLSIDAYLNILIQNNIALLCDVRKNPLSMKYGFSKKQLSKYCHNLGLEYRHLPELGIVSQQRQNLNHLADYLKLFRHYKVELRGKKEAVRQIKKLLDTYNRLALTCFEKDCQYCHRSILSDYYSEEFERIKPIHL